METRTHSLAEPWMTPPPRLPLADVMNSLGRPMALPNQSMTMVSSSVQAGLAAWKEREEIRSILRFVGVRILMMGEETMTLHFYVM